MSEWNDGYVENQGGNAGNHGENARNQDGNAGNDENAGNHGENAENQCGNTGNQGKRSTPVTGLLIPTLAQDPFHLPLT